MNKQTPLFYGIIGGVVVVLFFMGCYAADKTFFLNPALQWGALLFYIVFMYLAARADEAANEPGRDFRVRVRAPFLAFLYINLTYWLFYYGLHLYDPALIQLELTQTVDYLRKSLENGLGDPEQANKMRAQIVELEQAIAKPSPQPLGPVVVQMLQGAIGGFVLAAGVTLLTKKEQ
jgi:Protein of unknown function (DUF4199)